MRPLRSNRTRARRRSRTERATSVLERFGQVAFETGATGRWTSLSSAWTTLTGFDVSGTLGREVLDFIELRDRERARRLLFGNGSAPETRVGQFGFLCRNGAVLRLEVRLRTVPAPDGGPAGAAGLLSPAPARAPGAESGADEAASADRCASILGTVMWAARRFLEPGSWESKCGSVLEALGQATGVSRISICEDPQRGGRPLERCWAAAGVSSAPRANRYSEWLAGSLTAALRSGEDVLGPTRRFPEPARSWLEREEVKSLALLPVYAGRQWWGAIGFEDCRRERHWGAAELGCLRSMAGLLGATIAREQNEHASRYNAALLRTMADASPVALYVVDSRTDTVLYCNDHFCRLWGLEHLHDDIRSGMVSSRTVIEHCSRIVEDRPAFEAACARLRDQDHRGVIEERLTLRDGRIIRRLSAQIRDAEDQYVGRLSVFEDMTTRERAEDELRRAHGELELRVEERTAELRRANASLKAEITVRSRIEDELARREARFRALIDETQDVIFVVDHAGVIRYASPSVKRILGYDPEEMIGLSGFDFVHPEDLPEVRARFERILGATSPEPLQGRARHKDGSWRIVEVIGNNQSNNRAVGGIVMTLRDLTERRRLEDQFRQAQKMEAVGRLAGGVAHDFNNLLTVIRGYSGLLAKRLSGDETAERQVDQIQRASDRAAALVQQLLAFSRKQVVEPKTVDLGAAVRELEKMLIRLIGEDIELAIQPAAAALNVRIDPTQLEQIVINLTVNARDAMPEGGRLTISTVLHEPRGTYNCRDCKAASGRWAALAVRDTGIGINEEIRSHIFEPFFTTKDVGRGTGLGLSMVYGAVQQAGGHVCLDTVPGEGSTFYVCLPLAAEDQVPLPEAEPQAQAAGGSETVVVAEDEELVRTMISEALRDAGYRVLEAENGADALSLLERCPGPVSLLITDVIMPRMSGPALAAQVLAIHPETKTLFTSGYPRKELGAEDKFLKKPFTPDQLIRQVRAILDGR